ncbi:M50 family metallopeptidase [Paenibacillus filicis]|uniref:M50 family metallopeptidase n=1 Tax=Paenibacillus gyeongsangnamensis TaxID=3388067 RepID=A0ABT4QBN5_9BACL|nr:M50 family metallopeptidase [Paenibacillus filicis]MCZ8514228.1 M50 family metallopeptidase [Paenibacillus filicis]
MIYVLVAISIVITQIPFLNKYLSLINTIVHEWGHASFALLTGGKVYKIKLNTDTSGFALTGTRGWIGRFFTVISGYPFSALFPCFMIYLILNNEYAACYWILAMMLAVTIILWLRDLFSLIWAGSVLLILSLLIKYDMDVKWLIFVVMSISLVNSIKSSCVVFTLSFKDYRNAGDASSLSQMTLIPSLVWGGLFLVSTIAIVGYSILIYAGMADDYYLKFIELIRAIKSDAVHLISWMAINYSS